LIFYCHFVWVVINDLCDRLAINCFRISVRNFAPVPAEMNGSPAVSKKPPRRKRD